MGGIHARNAAWTPGKSDVMCSGLGSRRAINSHLKVNNYFLEVFCQL